MRTDDIVGASNVAFSAICGEDDDGSDGRFEGAMEVSEALDVQHVDFVDEQNTRDQLGNAYITLKA